MRMKRFRFDNNAYDDMGELEGAVHVETYTRPELGTDKCKELIVFAFYPDEPKDKQPEKESEVCECARDPYEVIEVDDVCKPVCLDCNKPIKYGLIGPKLKEREKQMTGPATTPWGLKMIAKVDELRDEIKRLKNPPRRLLQCDICNSEIMPGRICRACVMKQDGGGVKTKDLLRKIIHAVEFANMHESPPGCWDREIDEIRERLL